MVTVAPSITQKGFPALWECGGGYSNTGNAQLIAAPDGSPLRPVYVRLRGNLACGEHGLFIIEPGTIVVNAEHHRSDFRIKVSRVIDAFQGLLEVFHQFDQGEWDTDIPECLVPVVDAAKRKATTYHCRQLVWAVTDE